MAATDPSYLTQALALQLQELNRRLRRNPPRPPETRHRRERRPPIVGILLADLASGGTADAAVLNLQTTNEIQKVQLIGNPISGGTFSLQFQGKATGSLNFNATAAQMQSALQALSTVGQNNCIVTLGKGTFQNIDNGASTTEFPGVWMVQFTGALAGQTNLPLLIPSPQIGGLLGGPAVIVAQITQWADTGNVETVRSAIPVGTPTPMKAGATVMAHWFRGAGYVVGSCEARQFAVTYY